MTKSKPDFPEKRVLVVGRQIVNNNINSTASKVNKKKPNSVMVKASDIPKFTLRVTPHL